MTRDRGRFCLCACLGALALLFLLGCEPRIYAPMPPPPPPPPPAPPPKVFRPTFYVTASRLNLRACPGMDCPKISVLERNDEVEKVGEAEDWAQVRVKRDGRLGWVTSRYLADQPVPEAGPPPLPPPVVTPTPPLPEAPPPLPEKPPVAEKPKPVKPEAPVPGRKKVEEPKPAKPAEAAEPTSRKPAEKPAPEEQKPAPEPTPEKRIRIM